MGKDDLLDQQRKTLITVLCMITGDEELVIILTCVWRTLPLNEYINPSVPHPKQRKMACTDRSILYQVLLPDAPICTNASISQPVVHVPLVVRGRLMGGTQKKNIYL